MNRSSEEVIEIVVGLLAPCTKMVEHQGNDVGGITTRKLDLCVLVTLLFLSLLRGETIRLTTVACNLFIPWMS